MPASLDHKQRVFAHLGGQQTGDWAGELPWQAVPRHPHFKHCVDIKDANGKAVPLTSPAIARTIVSAVNERNKLFGDNVVYRDVLSSLFQQVYAMAPSHGRTRALDLIEQTLKPKDDLQ